ncbi:MAG: TIR domain-containing protein [Candidatus Glassbacteria bacterium]
MSNQFSFDVFLSHSAKDKPVVRGIAERLRADGLRVWFDEWEIRPGDSIPAKIEEGLEQSRVLVLCMSAEAFGSDWAQLEAGTFRFRDPQNKDRRFIPLRLDDSPIKSSLAQILYINWLPADREQEYPKLLKSCWPPEKKTIPESQIRCEQVAEEVTQLCSDDIFWVCAFSRDLQHILSGAADNSVRLWDLETGNYLCVLEGHTEQVQSVAWSTDQSRALSGAADNSVRLWDLETGNCLRVLEGHTNTVQSVAWSPDQRCALSGGADNSIRLWDLETGNCLRVLEGHTDIVFSVAWSTDQRHAISGAADKTVRLWDLETGHCLRVLEGHTSLVQSVACSKDQRYALSSSPDNSMRLWDVETGQCLHVLEDQTDIVFSVAWSTDQQYVLSCGGYTLRLWEVETRRCLRVLEGHPHLVVCMAWSFDQRSVIYIDLKGGIRVWDLSEYCLLPPVQKGPAKTLHPALDQVQYTNAKVLLVGDTSAGKTGLSMRLAKNDWQPSDSTVGAWATHLKLPVPLTGSVEREIWLWDFGGQADQRLIHQLYMEDTALAVLVFDGQKENLFEALGQWDSDLTRASSKKFTKLLVAGRVDTGGLRVSRSQIQLFAKERGFACFLETSAKADIGCQELKEAILDGIRWADIPWRTSPRVFKRLKDEIIQLKDSRKVLMRFNELRDALRLRLAGEGEPFKDEELKAVVGLLAGPAVVWELSFGS